MIKIIIAYIIAIASLLFCIFFLWKLSNKYILGEITKCPKCHSKNIVEYENNRTERICKNCKLHWIIIKGEPIEL